MRVRKKKLIKKDKEKRKYSLVHFFYLSQLLDGKQLKIEKGKEKREKREKNGEEK